MGAPASADSIQLKNGDILHGTIGAVTDTTLTLAHPLLGDITVQKDTVSSWSREQPAAVQAKAPQETSPPKVVSASPPSQSTEWKRKVGLGLYGNGSRGDTTSNNLHLFFDSEYEKEKDRWLFKMAYDLQEKGGDTTENKFFTQLDRDWTRTNSPWFWSARGRFDWDAFKDWRYRLGGFIGPGYQWIRTDTLDVRLRSGLGGTYTWRGEEKGFQPEGQLGADLSWKISPHQTLDTSTMFYLDLERPSHYRNTTSVGWSVDIDHIYRGLAFKFGITNEYDSNAAEDDSKDDFKYRFSVLLGL